MKQYENLEFTQLRTNLGNVQKIGLSSKEAEQRLGKLADFYNTLPIISTKWKENDNLKQQLLSDLNDYSYNSGQSWRLSF